MAKLSVNVNKIATLRNTRALAIPSVVEAIAGRAGGRVPTASPSTPRPDQRHVRPGRRVRRRGPDPCELPGAEFNIEGNPFFDYVHFAAAVRPTQCTLVPGRARGQDQRPRVGLAGEAGRLAPVIAS
jgi:pyridoxine 5-phosphate synthase